MSGLDIEGVLAAHEWTIKSLGRRQVVVCSCGDELLPCTSSAVATLADHRAHVAAVLNEQIVAAQTEAWDEGWEYGGALTNDAFGAEKAHNPYRAAQLAPARVPSEEG